MALSARKTSRDNKGKDAKARTPAGSKLHIVPDPATRAEKARRASDLLKHISDPTRLQIILMLANGEQQIQSVYAGLKKNPLSVTPHLALLRHDRILATRRKRTTTFYRLTTSGYILADVVQSLLDAAPTGAPRIRPKIVRVRSTPVTSPGSTQKRSTDLPMISGPISDVQANDHEEDWKRLNRRRADLIFKKNRDQLSALERSELEQLQDISRSRMQQTFPGPTLVDEKLSRIERRLVGDGAKKG